jgi:uncharacterized protein
MIFDMNYSIQNLVNIVYFNFYTAPLHKVLHKALHQALRQALRTTLVRAFSAAAPLTQSFMRLNMRLNMRSLPASISASLFAAVLLLASPPAWGQTVFPSIYDTPPAPTAPPLTPSLTPPLTPPATQAVDTAPQPATALEPQASAAERAKAEQLAQLAKTTNAFWAAIGRDDAWAMSNAIAAGVSPSATLPNGNTALHQAVGEPAPSIAAMLIKQPGVDINARNAAGETPLMLAVLRGQAAMAQALVAAKAAVNHPGWTPLHYAAASTNESAPAMISLLLEHYAYIDAESPNGTTPLMMAARYGLPASVAQLLEAGADATVANAQGLIALDFAKAGDKPDAIALLKRDNVDKASLPSGQW